MSGSYTLHSVSPLQHSFRWVSSHGHLGIINPIIQHLSQRSVQFVCNGVPFARKPIPFTKVSLFPSLHQGMPHPLSVHYGNYSIVKQNCPLLFDRAWTLPQLSQSPLFLDINPMGFTGLVVRQIQYSKQAYHGHQADMQKMAKWQSNSIDEYFSATSNTALLFSLSKQLYAIPGPSRLAPVSFPSRSTCHKSWRWVSLRRGCQASLLAFWRVAGCFSSFNVLGDREMILVECSEVLAHTRYWNILFCCQVIHSLAFSVTSMNGNHSD
jgi:hypothetical protein